MKCDMAAGARIRLQRGRHMLRLTFWMIIQFPAQIHPSPVETRFNVLKVCDVSSQTLPHDPLVELPLARHLKKTGEKGAQKRTTLGDAKVGSCVFFKCHKNEIGRGKARQVKGVK